MKIDKTGMVAMTKALQIYPKTVKDNLKGAKKVADWLTKEMKKLPRIKSVYQGIGETEMLKGWPYVCIVLDEDSLRLTTEEVVNLLYDSKPSIWTQGPSPPSCRSGIVINCQTLYHGTRKFPGNERLVFKRFKEILAKKR
jgi:hypothetical protein